jgi:hypothetical protein
MLLLIPRKFRALFVQFRNMEDCSAGMIKVRSVDIMSSRYIAAK